MILSVIIVNWNTRRLLRSCLSSLFDEQKEQVEVIVVDNGSTDGSAAMVELEFPQVKLVKNSQNFGFAKANNQGMKIAVGKYCLLLNSDTIVKSGALSGLVDFAEKHPEAGVVGCRLVDQSGTLQSSARNFTNYLTHFLEASRLFLLFNRNPLLGRFYYLCNPLDQTIKVDWVAGACFLVRREIFEKTGGFDERYFMFAEEMDWCRRIKRAGWQVYFTPAAEIIHLGGQSSLLRKDEMIVESFNSFFKFWKIHHPGYLSFRAVKLVTLLGLLPSIIKSFLSGRDSQRRGQLENYKKILTLDPAV